MTTPPPDDTARAAAYGARYGEPVDTYTWDLVADKVLEAAAPAIRADTVTGMDYGSWTLNHPWYATLIFGGAAIIGGLLGVALAAASVSVRLLSPANVPAGVAFGIGGVAVGMAAGMLVLTGIDRQRR